MKHECSSNVNGQFSRTWSRHGIEHEPQEQNTWVYIRRYDLRSAPVTTGRVRMQYIQGMFGRPLFSRIDCVLWPNGTKEESSSVPLRDPDWKYLVLCSFLLHDSFHVACRNGCHACIFCSTKSTQAPSCGMRWFLVLPWRDCDKKHEGSF